MRLDLFWSSRFRKSRALASRLIRAGFVRVGGATARPHQPVRSGNEIEVTEPPPEKIQTEPEAIPLTILYEDDDLIVINKPTGMTVHPGAGHREHTLVNALLHHCSMLSGIGGKERPGIVHRLDKAQGLPRRSKKRRGASGIIKTVHRAHSGKNLPCPGRRKIAERDRHNREQNRTTSGASAKNEREFNPRSRGQN